MTDDKRTLRDLLDERHARGAAVPGGTVIPRDGGLVFIRHPEPPQRRREPSRQVREEGEKL